MANDDKDPEVAAAKAITAIADGTSGEVTRPGIAWPTLLLAGVPVQRQTHSSRTNPPSMPIRVGVWQHMGEIVGRGLSPCCWFWPVPDSHSVHASTRTPARLRLNRQT